MTPSPLVVFERHVLVFTFSNQRGKQDLAFLPSTLRASNAPFRANSGPSQACRPPPGSSHTPSPSWRLPSGQAVCPQLRGTQLRRTRPVTTSTSERHDEGDMSCGSKGSFAQGYSVWVLSDTDFSWLHYLRISKTQFPAAAPP